MTIEDKIINIFTNPQKDTNIFNERTVFDIYFSPTEFKFRDKQMEALANNLAPCLEGNGPINSVVLGDYATGKTTAVKRLFKIIKGTTDEILCVYVNCKTYNTQYKVYTVIYHEIFGYEAPTKGVASTNIFNRMMRTLKKDKKTLIVALDDVNYLFKNKEGYDVFYTLLRAYETFNVKVGIIGIYTGFEFEYTLPNSINTVFIPQEIIFPNYTFDEVYHILSDRCKVGFQPGVLSEKLLCRISDMVIEKHDLRFGLDILKGLGYAAEYENLDKITDDLYCRFIKKMRRMNYK